MGLIKKFQSRRNLRSLRRKSKSVSTAAAVAAKAQSSTSTHDQNWEVHVTSNPNEYTPDDISLNWLTNKMYHLSASFNEDSVSTGSDVDGFEASSTGSDEADINDAPAKPTADKYETGWGWLSQCWGSPYLTNTTVDPTVESSYNDDGTGGSSQPSLSRVDQVLELSLADDVSDITSIPSMDDDSDSDSEHSSESEEESLQEEFEI